MSKCLCPLDIVPQLVNPACPWHGNKLVTAQPDPTKNELPAVWSLVVKDMNDRNVTGTAKYGTPLQPFNGRDAITDLYQELLDAVVYLRQHIFERDGQ